jgi:hypothetical protein
MNTSDENQHEYPLPPRELAWDMARAEARIQDARLKKDKALELLVVPKEMRDELAQATKRREKQMHSSQLVYGML